MFDPSLLDLAATEKEVGLTTFGRKTGRPSRRIIWISAIDGRLYLRSGLGLTRDWPKTLQANGRAVLHVAGRDVPVRARHVTDPAEARAMHAAVLGSRLEILSRAGHLSNLEAPAAFNIVLSEFLRESAVGFHGTGLH